MNWTGRQVEAEIGAVAHGGHCVARVEGRVVFVRHALPGERVLVKITEDNGGSFCRGDAITVLTASADRVEPPCPLARPAGCGGCDWQHATPEAQRRLKATVVSEQLERLAGLTVPVEVEALPGGSLHWRTRLRLATAGNGYPGMRGHHSHRVHPIRDCPIAVEGLLDGVLDHRRPKGNELELVLDDTNTQHVALREPIGRSRNWRTKWLAGGVAEQHAAGRTWKLGADAFWQVHPAAANTLSDLVREWAQAPVGGTAWDLYGGVGLFAGVLAEQVGETGRVLLVESVRSSVQDAEANLADLPQVRCVADKVERALVDIDEAPDVVVLDPPRKGAGKAVVDLIAAGEPDRVVYVACDPAALARDVAGFAEHGYRLAQLRAFDTFPNTHHVECVALLARTPSGEGHDMANGLN
ncbi:MAG TPA: class I SAM-dependent RNA methyltransferase [Pseudonocardiaceae bacterium]|nr:class I SAM-dependent RNA methyltransferase [Pseudonocardiaceae bacterium]